MADEKKFESSFQTKLGQKSRVAFSFILFLFIAHSINLADPKRLCMF